MGVGILIPAEKITRGPHKILCTCGAKWHQNSDFLGECIPRNALCHCEEQSDVAISRKGNRISLDVFKIAQENHIFLKSLYLTNIVC